MDTEPGVVMGTLGYMSPEQVRGKPAGARSDIFSFGAILYEMLSGRRAFHGDSAADTMTAILREDPPDLSSTNRLIAPSLDRIVLHCLEKNPEARFHSAHDLAFNLDALSGAQAGEAQAPPPTARRPKLASPLVATSAIALLFAAALASVLVGRRARPESAERLMRFTVPMPPGTTYSSNAVSRSVAISPDGTRLVIEAVFGGRSRLYLRPLDSEQAVELEGSLDATAPFWSPDSRFIAFFAGGKLKKIPATGGHPEVLSDAPFAIVGTWSREGTILFSRFVPPGIHRVPDTGGQAIHLLSPDPSRPEESLQWPFFLPDGRRFLYFVNRPYTEACELRLASLDSKESRLVARPNSRAEYVAPGYLVFVREGDLYAQPFDERKAQLHGEPHLLAENVHYHLGPSNAAFSVSETGVLAYETAAPPSRLIWLDRAGREVGQLGPPSVVQGIRISPEGRRAAIDVADRRTGTADIWLFELSRGVSTRLHFDSVDEILPAWSPDGAKLIYRSDRQGAPDAYEMTIGVPGSEKPVLKGPGGQQPEDISRDGRFLAYLNLVERAGWSIWLLPLQEEPKPLEWLGSGFNETSPRFSPDGRWIAYESDESGEAEIYAALTEGAGEKRRISPAGGRRPRWRRDGKELYYIAPGGVLMALPVALGPPLDVGAPVALFRVESNIENYDVLPDGSRFLVSTPVQKVRESPIRVIVNWTAALERDPSAHQDRP